MPFKTKLLAIIMISIFFLFGCGLLQDSPEEGATLPAPQVVTNAPVVTLAPTLEANTAVPGATDETIAPTATLPTTPTPEITPTVEITLNVPAVIAPQVTVAAGQPNLNQDILFIAGRALQLRSATTGGITTLLPADNSNGVTAFSVTVDGERVVAARMVNPENRTFELMRIDIRSGNIWKLADAPNLLDFAVSPDGRYALYVAGGRPFEPSESVAELEAENPNFHPMAGTVYLANMETHQSRPVGQCVDIPEGADWSPEFLVSCQGVFWTNDSQNMVWADVSGIWLRNLNASQPSLSYPNAADLSEPPNVHQRPLSFAKNGRHMLIQRIFFESLLYEVVDLASQEYIEVPDSVFGIGSGFMNVNWMQDDRLFKLYAETTAASAIPTLELWRIQGDNSITKEETFELTNLPPQSIIRYVQHFENGRFGFQLTAQDPNESGLFIMASSNELPEKINGLPFNQVAVIWQPNGSGAIVEQRDAIGNFLYTPAGGNVYYDLQSAFGPNAHAFFWRP